MAYASISKPSLHFNTKLFTGDGTTSNSITGVGFQPDWVWIKSRNHTNVHSVYDAVRGIYKRIQTNQTNAEYAEPGAVKAFDSDGFTLGNWTSVNGSGHSQVAWNWKANGSGSSNTDGSITSTVSANTTSGFSIVSYTGTGATATVGHGLGVAPKMVFYKNRTDVTHWYCITTAIDGSVDLIHLNLADAEGGGSSFTAPTNSLLNLTSSNDINGSGDNIIAYCFAEKKGYSKFGSYTGNNNADGPFIYTGFKPAFVIIKRTDSTNNWGLFDNKRNPDNPVNKLILPNVNNAEDGNNTRIDMYSNGFKPRVADPLENASGGTHIYMAFAEEPLVANVGQGIPATAR